MILLVFDEDGALALVIRFFIARHLPRINLFPFIE